jgi:ribose-phosphate pyrophosphokinase
MPPNKESIALYSPAGSAAIGGDVAKILSIPLSRVEESKFTGGERRLRPLDRVQGRPVCVIHSLFGGPDGSANDRVCELLFLVGALKDLGARHITACLPYLAYARQDRRNAHGDPVTLRYLAQMFEAAGVQCVICLEVHNPAAFENAFRCQTVHLETAPLFVRHFASKGASGPGYAVVSPDIGGAKRARLLQGLLQAALRLPVSYAIMDKNRVDGVLSGTLFAGDVAGKHVIIVDDLISSGGTILRAISACRRSGASLVHVAATHASFAPEARRLFDPATPVQERPDSLVVTDSIPLAGDFLRWANGSLTVLAVAPMLAEAIGSLATGV